MLEIETREIVLSDGRKITACEANHIMSRKLQLMEDEIKKNPPKTPADMYMDALYPTLACYSKGDIPTRDEALKMATDTPQDFDLWFCSVRALNPSKFAVRGGEKDKTRSVVLRDGSKITVINSANHPSFVFRAQAVHDEVVRQSGSDDPELMVFKTLFYPAMAACSVGDVPNPEQVDNWPETELAKWYAACEEENPSLFPASVDKAKAATAEDDGKKKPTRNKRPRK
jgi:hypothetical protein